MGTTNTDFVYVTGSNPILVGSAVITPPVLAALGPKETMAASQVDQVAGGSGSPNASNSTVAGRLTFDPALVEIPVVGTPYPVPDVYGTTLGGFAKNGCVLLELSGTTAQIVNFSNTTTNTPAATAGDTQFATLNVIRVKNLGTSAITISPGSNPSPLPAFTGTSPTISIPAGSEALFHSAAGGTVSGSAENLTFTPAATGNVLVTIGGA